MSNRKNIVKNIVILNLVFLIFTSCSDKSSQTIPKEKILARVGDRIITDDEFRYSYEFSVSTLRKGENPRRQYLDYMIKELLLANEGYRLGFDENPYVTTRVKNRQNSDLLKAFVAKNIHDKIKIKEEDLQDAIKKSTIKFRLIIWPTPSLAEAERVREKTRQSTLDDYVEKTLALQEVRLEEKRFYETDWIDYLEMPPHVFDKIKDLEMGKTSEPFSYGNGYAVAQVLDINLEGIIESELLYGARRKKMEQRLHNIEADKLMHALMDSILTPRDIRVKGHMVKNLVNPLYSWVKDGLPEQRSLFSKLETVSDTTKSYLKEIYTLLDETLVTSKNERKTVRDYLLYLDYNRKYLKESKSKIDFENRLVSEIGDMIQDESFIELAGDQGLDDSASVTQDLRLWEQKWTYEIYRHEVIKDLEVSEKEMKDFFNTRWQELVSTRIDTNNFERYENEVYNAVLHEKYIARLENKIKELENRYPIWINDKLLEEIELTASKKSNPITLFVRNSFDGKPIVPTVEMNWVQF